MSDFNDRKDTITLLERLLKSKYSDLIILLVVTMTFLMLIIISTA